MGIIFFKLSDNHIWLFLSYFANISVNIHVCVFNLKKLKTVSNLKIISHAYNLLLKRRFFRNIVKEMNISLDMLCVICVHMVAT